MRHIGWLKILFLMIFLLVIALSWQTTGAQENQSSPPSQEVKINQNIIRGIELLYDWKYDEAENLFTEEISKHTDDPMGYFYLAMVTWSKLASGFWASEMVEQYGVRIDKTIAVAKQKIEKGEADSFTYLYLGGALGFKGRFELMQRKWFSSFLLALDAIEALKTSLRMDPNNKDVLFGLGIFDYYTDRLSGVLRFLSFLLVHKGNKEEGLRKMHVAAEEAIYSNIEAKSLLLHIYLFLEPGYSKALPLAEELANRFRDAPRNLYLQGLAYVRLGMHSEYRAMVEYLNQRGQKETSPVKASIWNKQSLYLEASYYLFHHRYDMARAKLQTILFQKDPEKDPFMIAWPLLKIGMSYDIEKKRKLALDYYNNILKMENGSGAQFLAEKYIDEPTEGGDPFLGY
jgi:tetratricopeptide (TPR) repeat protein